MASPAELTNYFGPISLSVMGVWAWWKNRAARKERAIGAAQTQAQRDQAEAIKNDANLRDDQREFITVLQNENRTWRAEVAQLHTALDALRADMEKLRAELGTERRARESAESRYLDLLERRKQIHDGTENL